MTRQPQAGGSLRIHHKQSLTNVFTLNVRGQNITCQTFSRWERKREKKKISGDLKKIKTNKTQSHLCTTTVSYSCESSQLSVTPRTFRELEGPRCACASGVGGTAIQGNAVQRRTQVSELSERGRWDEGFHDAKRSCTGHVAEALRVELLSLLLLLHCQLLRLVRCWQLVD